VIVIERRLIVLKHIFKDPRTLDRLHEEPLGPFVDSFADMLREQGYTLKSARLQIQMVAAFNQWLQRKNATAQELTQEHFRKYIRYRDRCHLSKRNAAISAVSRFLEQLCHKGVIAQEVAPAPSAAEKLSAKFGHYLLEERALAATTVAHYCRFVLRFLVDWLGKTRADLNELSAVDIIQYVQRRSAKQKAKQSKAMVTALRSFLQFARYQNYITSDLAAAVPTVALWEMAGIPKFLPRNQVELVLSSCNRQTAVGRRDYAILLLLARLGLRAGEIVSLTLEDIDWREGRISVNGKTGHRPRLPLPPDVGEALAVYLQNGRQKTKCRTVFLRGRAPIRELKNSSAVCRIVSYALLRAGIDTPRKGAHQFRHSLATELLRKGASLMEIGELLGHRSPRTTTIYAKVDLPSLSKLSMPWPGGAK
jgi:site-specific recombinase XerD